MKHCTPLQIAKQNAQNIETSKNSIWNQPKTAKQFCDAIRTIANKPENLENLEIYLSMHFIEWLEKFANTPETITAELKAFAEMEI
jgi:hypothetical protein